MLLVYNVLYIVYVSKSYFISRKWNGFIFVIGYSVYVFENFNIVNFFCRILKFLILMKY